MTDRKRAWVLVAMGAWIAGSICTSVVATENFYTIDRLLAARANAAFASAVDRLGSPEARDLLRYLSSELNRLYFQLWNAAQIVLGALLLWLMSGSSKEGRFAVRGVIGMLAIVVVMMVWLTPAIVTLGRSLDFVPRDPAPPGMSRFWILHAAYTSLEMVKLLVGVVVTISLTAARRSSSSSPRSGSAPTTSALRDSGAPCSSSGSAPATPATDNQSRRRRRWR